MIVQTTRYGVKGHNHLVYLPMKDGQVSRQESSTTEDRGHSHKVIWFAPPPQVDPMTGQPVGPQIPPAWQILPADDGHTHEIAGEPDRKKPEWEKDDEELVDMVHRLWKQNRELEQEARDDASECEEFYEGEQWDQKTKRKLEEEARAPLTLNYLQSAVDVLSGYLRQNRTDIKFLPTEDGDVRVADIYSALAKQICEQSGWDAQEVEIFEDEVIVGRGLIHSYVSYDRTLEGDIIIERYPWDQVYFGPHERIDLEDCTNLQKTKWFSEDRVKQLWPEKADEVTADIEDVRSRGTHVQSKTTDAYDENKPQDTEGVDQEANYYDLGKKNIRVIECEKKLYSRIPVVANVADDFYWNADGLSEKQVEALKAIGLTVVRRPLTKMQRIVIAGSTLLEKEVLDSDEFSVTAVYAKKRRDKWWGVIARGLDPQRQVNKLYSQGMDIINRMNGYGWFSTPDTFPNEKEKSNFKKSSAKPGFHVEITSFDQKPQREEGTRFPSELAEYQSGTVSSMRELLGVNSEILGQQGDSTSAITFMERRNQALLGNEYLFDNLRRAKKRLGKRLVGLIQKIYTPQRIMRVVSMMNERSPVEVGGQPLQQHNPDELEKMLSDSDITRYDIAVGESAYSPTQRQTVFVMMLELQRAGVSIPPDVLLDVAPIPGDQKDKARQALQAQAAAEKEAADTKYRTEILKSMPDGIKQLEWQKMQQANQGQGGAGQGAQSPGRP